MANFVRHEPCPNCGSRDNLGRYDDGSAFCFGCEYRERATHYRPKVTDEHINREIPALPDDTSTNYSAEAVAWLGQYHLSIEESIKAGIRWSDSKQQLIFLLEDGCWQARNFYGPVKAKRKYFTAGNVNDSIKLYLVSQQPVAQLRSSTEQEKEESQGNRTLAVVEDCVSAIRIAGCDAAGGACDAMPVLGSHVSRERLCRIARLYSHLIIWLDHDKFKEAQALASSAKMLGLSSRLIYTDLDPKCYTDEELTTYIKDTQ